MNYWLAVASANHVSLGVAGGFMQVCHGKKGPLARMKPNDGIVYYSPSRVMGQKDGLKAFTAAGYIQGGEPYSFDMGEGFVPFRRDVEWLAHCELPITPLLERLDLTAGKKRWGYQLRFGVLPLSERDFTLVLNLMRR